MIRDRGSNFTAAFDAVLADAGIRTVLCNVRTPRMNAIAERWIGGCRRELLDRTLIWNQDYLRRILCQYETHHNRHQPHRSLNSAAPLKPLPEPVDLERYSVRRHARVSGMVNEYRPAPATGLRLRCDLRDLQLLPDQHRVPAHPLGPARRRPRQERGKPRRPVQLPDHPDRPRPSIIMTTLTTIARIMPNSGRCLPDAYALVCQVCQVSAGGQLKVPSRSPCLPRVQAAPAFPRDIVRRAAENQSSTQRPGRRPQRLIWAQDAPSACAPRQPDWAPRNS
jgi:hypothetical protein